MLFDNLSTNGNSRTTVIMIGGENRCFGSRAADFETITARGVFRPSNVTVGTAAGRLMANVWMQEKEMDNLELWLAKLHEIRRRLINIDAWCSHAVKVYGQCFRCCSRFHHRLVSCTLTQIQKIHSSFTFISTSITVYSFCNLC